MSSAVCSQAAFRKWFLFFVGIVCGIGECCAQEKAKPAGYSYTLTFQDMLENLSERRLGVLGIEILDKNLRVIVSIPRDAPVDQFLDSCLSGTNYTYQRTSAGISFGYRGADTSSPYRHLEDTLTDESGRPIAGATVTGNGMSVETDAFGHFSLRVRGFDTRVEVSCVGYRAENWNLSNKSNRKIGMQVAVTNLDMTYVSAYGNTTQRKNPGDVFPLQGADLGYIPAGNVLAGLSARVPGLYDQTPNGVSGSAHNTTLGGIHSVYNGNFISYILDGVPLATNGGLDPIGTGSAQGPTGASALNFIPPDLIDSVSVLKDASAMAPYGSWSANGVVLLTLKPAGRDSGIHVSVDLNQGVGHVVPTSRTLSTSEFLQLRQEAVKNDGLNPNDTTVPELQWGNRQSNFKRFTTGGTARISNARLSVNGGNPGFYYLVSGNLHRETGVFPSATSDERNGLYTNVRFEPKNRKGNRSWRVVLSLLYTAENNRLPVYDPSAYAFLAPNVPSFYNPAGQLQWGNWPLSFLNIPGEGNNAYTGNVYTLFGHIAVSYQVNCHLSIEQSLGYNGILTNEKSVQPIAGRDTSNNPGVTGTLTLANNHYSRTIMETIGRWDSWIRQSEIKGVLGVDMQDKLTSFLTQTEGGYTNDQLLYAGFPAPQTSTDQNKVYDRYAAIFAKVDFIAYSRYLLTASWRCDGSSRFGPGNQYGNFWAVAGGWIFTEEPFLRGNKFLTYGKIRSSLGTTGNDQIVDGGYAEVYGQGPPLASYQGQQGVMPVSLANIHLRWEQNYRAEAALEFGFIKNRILISVIASRNWSTNQVINAPVAPVAGLSAVWSNQPVKLVNDALEMVLEASLLSGKKISWKTKGSITIPRNKLARWPGLANSQDASTYVVGKSLTVTKGYHYMGVNPQNGLDTFRTKNVSGIPGPGDRVPDAGLDPRLYAGWEHKIRLNHFELGVLFDIRFQNAVNPLILLAQVNPPGEQAPAQLSNGPVEWLDRWKKPGDHARLQQVTATPGSPADIRQQLYLVSDAYSIDGSYIRLKYVSMTFYWPDSWLKKKKLRSGKFYVVAQNLLTYTHYPVADPETQNPLVLPPLRVISAGISVGF